MNAMKKTAIAMAVAAATGVGAAANADTTLYGSARISVNWEEIEPPLADKTSSWDVRNDASRLGVRGSEDLGGGLSAIYQYEFGVDTTEGGSFNNNRPKWVGLKGGWGSVMAGTQWTPYYNVMGVLDTTNTDSYSLAVGNFNILGLHRTDNTVAYVSPNFSGFQFQAALMANGLQRGTITTTGSTGGAANVNTDSPLPNTGRNLDAYNVSGIYQNGPLFAGVTWQALLGDQPPDVRTGFDPGDRGVFGLAVGYTFGPLGIAFGYEDGDVVGGTLGVGDNQASNYSGRVSYTMGNLKLEGGVNALNADRPSDIGGDADILNWIVGAQYNFSKRSRVWIEYLGRDGDKLVADKQLVSMGMRHDF